MYQEFVEEFVHSFTKLELGVIPICLRLLCAMLVGLVIGTEREYTNRPAGMRTHVLVALGACVVSLTGQTLFQQYSLLGATPDPARLTAQVVTGVGFLGAGTIMREGMSVRGLTTAASLWTVACLGIAAGYGYYAVALIGTVFMFVTLTILEGIQHHLPGRAQAFQEYEMECEDVAEGLNLLHHHASKQTAYIRQLSSKPCEGGFLLSFRAEFSGLRGQRRQDRFFAALSAEPQIHKLRYGEMKEKV